MGIPVMILGTSGSGKSASLRNLNPESYSLIEVNGKPLPFKTDKKFVSTDDYKRILYLLEHTQKNLIVIDDSQYLMANEFMRRAGDKGFQKFTDIGVSFWQLINHVQKLPNEKIVYFMHHIEPDGYGGFKAKTIGKMIDDKINLEGMFSIVIRAKKSNDEYFFSTQSDGSDPVKTPMSMFESEVIDNDLSIVDDAIRSFYDFPFIPEIEKKKQTDKEQQYIETGQDRSIKQPELKEILEATYNGYQVFQEKEKEFFHDMLTKSGIQWVLMQAKIAAAKNKSEIDNLLENGQRPLF